MLQVPLLCPSSRRNSVGLHSEVEMTDNSLRVLCLFGQSTTGSPSLQTQQRVRSEEVADREFAKAVEIATGMEEVAKNSRMLQSSWTTPRDMSTSEVGQSPRDILDRCYYCGKPQDTGLPNANSTMHKWNFHSKRTPSVQDYLQSLENTILHYLLPALMDPSAISTLERKLQLVLGY